MKNTQFVVHGKADAKIKQVRDALKQYTEGHPQAKVDINRRFRVAIQIRIVDPDFAGIDRADRHDLIWDLFAGLPQDVTGEILVLLLLTPEESKDSFANLEFDQPARSRR